LCIACQNGFVATDYKCTWKLIKQIFI
jgi:hypothetical protein